ncbi:unnamed protein product [Calicophoron daubneyi]|uniref:Uncharacterized protein n=1 Tax=Calicophoron daubneyi TaxID=300641 RepID=A0AAV2T4F4_CALDB
MDLVIPNEVLKRYGGLTNNQKYDLYRKFNSINFVSVPEFLKHQIGSVSDLSKFAVCKSPTGQYFVCPSSQPSSPTPFEQESRYCCGFPPQQYCCTLSQFKSDIHIVQSALVISPSVVLGVSILFLMIAALITIVACARCAHGLRKQSSRLRYSISDLAGATHSAHLSKSSACSSHIPPRRQLLSSATSETYSIHSSHQNLAAPVEESTHLPKSKQFNTVAVKTSGEVVHARRATYSSKRSSHHAH